MTWNTGGFVDLRVHRASEASHSDDSMWPSFTDIMMVIVMIFLMASVIFMLRNVQLGKDLQSSLSAETEATQEIRSLQERSAYLSEIIKQTEQRVVDTERLRREASILAEQRGTRVAELEYETADLYRAQAQLNLELDGLNTQLTEIRVERAQLTDRIASMNSIIADLESVSESKSQALTILQQNFDQKLNELQALE